MANVSESQKRNVLLAKFFFCLKVNLLALYVAKFERCSFKNKKVIAVLLKSILQNFLDLGD